MSAINAFLLKHDLRIAQNPCISPDFCLDWPALLDGIRAGRIHEHAKSHFATAQGAWTLLENAAGDCAWKVAAPIKALAGAATLADRSTVFPATWANLLTLKNLVLEHDAGSTIFPGAGGNLGRGTLGVGARFTTLHWPAVEWAMGALDLGVTANQNSIPRELVYDVDAMLGGRLDTVSFPFIGTDVPEGHQGQSVEGMSHGCVLSKLKTGFHHRRIAWSFNADHQPIGGKFDSREDALVRGCLLASYITFDLSPELALGQPAPLESIPAAVVARTRARVAAAGLAIDDAALGTLLSTVWPAMLKMKRRDEKYAAARAAAFSTDAGRRYLRELSIDELPGLTSAGTTAVMLALCEALDMPVNFVAPAFGFQKNMPYPDDASLRTLIRKQWDVCAQFGVSIGFHSGSGKSAENYRAMGEVTGSRLEIKTSGRYTYEMGVALSQSGNAADQALWRDWYRFTLELAMFGAFSDDATEQRMARIFITTALASANCPVDVFASPAICRTAMEALPASPEHMFFFEYNFLFVLAAGGRAEKAALGDHSPAGYAQRARFYAISPEARLNYSRRVASYLIFLAETTGLAPAVRCAGARALLAGYETLDEMLGDISPPLGFPRRDTGLHAKAPRVDICSTREQYLVHGDPVRKINTRSFVRATFRTSREINRRIALNVVREHGPISRADLARQMGVGRGMVTALISELLAAGAIYEGDAVNAPRGRRPTMIYVRTKDRLAIAIDVRLSSTYLMLSDFSGAEIALETFATIVDPTALADELASRIRRMIRRHRKAGTVQGVGLVVPGMVDQATGRVLNAPQVGWRDVDLKRALAERIGLPVYIEGAPIACALGQMWLGEPGTEAPRDFAYVIVGDGVGAGVVVNGEVLRGAGHTAGEFGHVPVDIEGVQCMCGARGCVEAYTSNLATLVRYSGHAFSPQEARAVVQASGLTIGDVLARARSGDQRAGDALDMTARYLGVGLAVMINTLNPARIFVGGEITAAWDRVEPILRAAVKERALTALAADTPIVPGRTGSYPRLRGGTALVVAPQFAIPHIA